MNLRSALRTLLVFALGLPLVQAVLVWVGGMLAAMGDNAGAAIVRHVGTGCLVAWSVALVALVIALALQAVNEPSHDPRSEG